MRRVGAVILAAGASTRLGQPKQLAILQGERLLERAVRVAVEAGCSPVIVVLGCDGEKIAAECDMGVAHVVVNGAWPEGMATSVHCGVEQLAGVADAVVLMTCDQPAATSNHLRRLMELCGDEPVASSYAGRCGVPAYFPAEYFNALRQLAGDAGARSLLDRARSVELPGGELDIDTPASLVQARATYPDGTR